MTPGTLMVQGTTSDAGKSTLVAALGRVLVRRGLSVAPFKPQNMALNSAVGEDGGELGRAQALQALACRVTAHTDMNPVLIKPSSDIGAQIIVQGKVLGNMNADTYHAYKPTVKAAVFDSFQRLLKQYDAIVIEGAGSPAEINLRQGDIANMGFAEEADCPVIIIADIDKGGVFAHLVGTLELLSPSEQARVKGFVINKFRGDIHLLNPGLAWLTKRTGRPVLGVLPYIQDFYIDAEDAISTQQIADTAEEPFSIVVPVFPRISNHTDFDPLRLHPRVNLQFVSLSQPPPPCDLIILPGSKNVRADVTVLLNSAWPAALRKHLRYGGKLIGICGGFQMLGSQICDPLAIEGPAGTTAALGLLPVSTELAPAKSLLKKTGSLQLDDKKALASGYEIHHGISHAQTPLRPAVLFNDESTDGYISDDNQIFGTYLHGIFDEPEAGALILNWAGLAASEVVDINQLRESQLERLADIAEEHLDIDSILSLLNSDTDTAKAATDGRCS